MPYSGWYSISKAHFGLNCMASMQCIKLLMCGHRAQHFTGTRHAKPQTLFGCVLHFGQISSLPSNYRIVTPSYGIYLSCDLRLVCVLVTTPLNPSSCVYAIMLHAWHATPNRIPIRKHRVRKLTFNFHIERQETCAKVQHHSESFHLQHWIFAQSIFFECKYLSKAPKNLFGTFLVNLLAFAVAFDAC